MTTADRQHLTIVIQTLVVIMLLLIDDDDDDDDTGRVLTTLENMEISGEFVNFGKLREFKIYSGNLSNAVFCDAICA